MKKYKVVFEVADNFNMRNIEVEKVVLAKIKNKEKHFELEITKCELIIGEEENNGLKPLPKDEGREYYGCPSCRHIVSSVQNYCENCGQKLDWGDIGETE